MIAKISPAPLFGTIDIIISKSFAHRIMIAAALSDRETHIVGRSDAKDLEATARCLTALGATVTSTKDGYRIKPAVQSGNGLYDTGESGSTLRFMLPIAAALGREGVFTGEGRLAERPLNELITSLTQGGATIKGEKLPYTLQGKLKAGSYRIRGDISSQYITGLLFALPLLDGDSEIIIEGKAVSRGYIDITLEVLKAFKIKIEDSPRRFFVKGGQKYISPERIVVEGDWSNAAFWLAAGAMGGDITVRGLNLHSVQEDRRIIEILAQAGANLQLSKEGVRVVGSPLKSIELYADAVPDLVPITGVMLSQASGKSTLNDIERLRLKECDRISAIIHLLSNMGIQNSYEGSLKIQGGKLLGGVIDGHNDHRIVMAAAIAAAYASGETTIKGAESVTKSYPDFFNKFSMLGGKVKCV
ncbi:MAG: 3-phosphoshikimate 1-carboxyvinyltransferase [Clostridia bacterium]